MEANELENIASLIGEPSRFKMLWSLLDGRAYTATELAHFSDTSPQSASMHLAKLVQASLLQVRAQGRHRYYTFARDEIAFAVEALGGIAKKPETIKKDTSKEPIRNCRTCYDHLAGKVAVVIHDRLFEKKYLSNENGDYELTSSGEAWFNSQGIDIAPLLKQKRPLLRPCLDWSERRYHLAGALGSALLSFALEKDLFRKIQNSRALVITSKGQQAFHKLLQINI